MGAQTKEQVVLAGDGIINEQDGCKYCLGCVVCEEVLERETDI